MIRTRIGTIKRLTILLGGAAFLAQAGGCPVNVGDLGTAVQAGQSIVGAVVQQSAAVIADTAFFFLDNFFVRLTGS